MGTLDPRKLIEMNINHMNNFHMKISRITVHSVIDKININMFISVVPTSDIISAMHLSFGTMFPIMLMACRVSDL